MIALRSRYDLMSLSSTHAPDGTYFPDPLTVDLTKFVFNDNPLEYTLNQGNIDRPDVLMTLVYGVPEYDDIVFWLNNISYIDDVSPGTVIYIPSKADMEKYFSLNTV